MSLLEATSPSANRPLTRPLADSHSKCLDGELAIYSTADSRYVPACIVTLSSFRRFHPRSGIYLIADGKRLSTELLEMLREFRIELVDVDLRSNFPVASTNTWPSEAFWHLAGPQIFAQKGYRYSLAVDGDVFCTRPMALDTVLSQLTTFAGNDNGPSRWLLREPERLKALLDVSRLDWPAPNAGVIFYANQALVENGFLERASALFDVGKTWAFQHLGDQALLAMTVLALDMRLLPLGCEWNFRFDLHVTGNNAQLRKRLARDPRAVADEVYVVHFLGGKPWTSYPTRDHIRTTISAMARGKPPTPGWNTAHPARVYWVDAWRSYAQALLGQDRVRRYFGSASLEPVLETRLGRSWLKLWDQILWLNHVNYTRTNTPWGVNK